MHGLYPGHLVKNAAWLVGVGITLVVFSCDPELSLEEALKNKRCAAVEPRCLGDDVCNSDNVCVPRNPLSEDVEGTAGAGSAGAGGVEVGGPSGAGGADGSESNGDGMDTKSSDVPDAGDAAPPCTPVTLFVDRDGDGFGSDTEPTTVRCPSAGYATRGGDCFDAEVTADNHAEQVHEGQLGFFAEGYPRPGQPGEISFDYDCSLREEAAPGNPRVATNDCGLAFPDCTAGTGVLATDRAGAGINALCGSQSIVACSPQNGACVSVVGTTRTFLCH
jgi:hypothetical protein